MPCFPGEPCTYEDELQIMSMTVRMVLYVHDGATLNYAAEYPIAHLVRMIGELRPPRRRHDQRSLLGQTPIAGRWHNLKAMAWHGQ